MRSFEYDEAAALLEQFIRENPPAAQELEARARLVRALASAGNEEAAQAAATTLYTRDPGYPVPTDERYSPRILAFYTQAAERAQEAPPAPIRIVVRPETGRITFALSAETNGLVSTAELWVRSGGEGYETVAVTRTSEEALRFEAAIEPVSSIQYYARLLAPSGYVLAGAGGPNEPISWRNPFIASETPQPSTPSPSDSGSRGVPKWILAGGIGLAVAGAAVGLLLWAPWSSDDPSLGTRVELP